MNPSTLRARSLAAGNVLYRDPGLHDFLDDGGTDASTLVATLAADYCHLPAPTLIDLGSGTGLLAGALPRRIAYLGVDVQPRLVDHARRNHPRSAFEVGDLLGYRAGRTFDLITCLGNTLAYLHTDDELSAACETFAAHAGIGTLLILGTLVTPPRVGRSEQTITVPGGTADVAVETSWCASTCLASTIRTWDLPDGTTETDRLVRRVHDLDALGHALRRTGFSVVETFDHLSRRGEPVIGPTAIMVAHANGEARPSHAVG